MELYLFYKKVVSSHSVIHVHGLWGWDNHIAVLSAKNQRKKVIISTHGMLHPFALRNKFIKKSLALNTYQKRDLECSDVIHATSLQEAQHVRNLGVSTPIAVIPIGVDIPANFCKNTDYANHQGHLAVFIGRLHKIKGLENLLLAWSKVKPLNWKLVIAGPDSYGYKKQLIRMIYKLHLTNDVEIIGYVNQHEKTTLLGRASIFVHPSFSENFSVSIGEALAHSVPVLTTTQTPWGDIVANECGWISEPTESSVVDALFRATSTDSEILDIMGKNGVKLIEKNYSWCNIRKKYKELYEWIENGSNNPGFLFYE